ncbi:MAG: hypothetical protein HUK03_02495 [Bacteroidaceae bacterium]|nr:hypothetical protein [Bacteroidaceae bacterium]
MRKVILILIAVLISAFAEVRGQVDEGIALEETTLVVAGNNVRVTGANGETLEVFKITGEQVTLIRIDSDSKSFKLNLPKGCYILRVGKLTRKISIC